MMKKKKRNQNKAHFVVYIFIRVTRVSTYIYIHITNYTKFIYIKRAYAICSQNVFYTRHNINCVMSKKEKKEYRNPSPISMLIYVFLETKIILTG